MINSTYESKHVMKYSIENIKDDVKSIEQNKKSCIQKKS